MQQAQRRHGGRLLSQFLVQLILVREAGRRYHRSHDDRSDGERRSGEGRGREARAQRGARSGRREGGEPRCSNKDLLSRRRATLGPCVRYQIKGAFFYVTRYVIEI